MRYVVIGASAGAGLMWLVATALYFISMTDYPYPNVVGGFVMLAVAVGALIGFLGRP